MSGQGGAVKGSSGLRMWTEKVDARRHAGFDAVFVAAGDQEIVGRDLAPMSTWLDRVRANATPLTWLGNQQCVSHGEAGYLSPSVRHSAHHLATGGRASASRAAPLHDGLVAALRLISREAGERVARHVAEHFLVAFHTAPGPVLDEVSASTRADKMRAAARWLQDNCHRPVSVEDVADVTAMSRRSLLRHFRQETGMTPSEYLLHARLALACRFLLETDLPVDKIARRVGMSNGDHLAKVFRRNLRLSPLEYRHRYLQGYRDAESGGPTVVGCTAIRGVSSNWSRAIDQLRGGNCRSLQPERKPASDGPGS